MANQKQKNVNQLSFEDAFAGLEKSVDALRSDDVSLDDSMKVFEEGMAYYKQCAALLAEAKGKVEAYSAEKDTLEAFES